MAKYYAIISAIFYLLTANRQISVAGNQPLNIASSLNFYYLILVASSLQEEQAPYGLLFDPCKVTWILDMS